MYVYYELVVGVANLQHNISILGETATLWNDRNADYQGTLITHIITLAR